MRVRPIVQEAAAYNPRGELPDAMQAMSAKLLVQLSQAYTERLWPVVCAPESWLFVVQLLQLLPRAVLSAAGAAIARQLPEGASLRLMRCVLQ